MRIRSASLDLARRRRRARCVGAPATRRSGIEALRRFQPAQCSSRMKCCASETLLWIKCERLASFGQPIPSREVAHSPSAFSRHSATRGPDSAGPSAAYDLLVAPAGRAPWRHGAARVPRRRSPIHCHAPGGRGQYSSNSWRSGGPGNSGSSAGAPRRIAGSAISAIPPSIGRSSRSFRPHGAGGA